MKISKELFEAVMDWTIDDIFDSREDIIIFDVVDTDDYTHMNYNDFFFKCKEWAYEQGFDIWSITWGACELYNIKTCSPTERFDADSEQQAVFDACQWIMENSNGQQD